MQISLGLCGWHAVGLHWIGSFDTILYIHRVDFFGSILFGLLTSALYDVGRFILHFKKKSFFN